MKRGRRELPINRRRLLKKISGKRECFNTWLLSCASMPIVCLVPSDKPRNPLFDRNAWLEVEQPLTFLNIGIGFEHLARLHGEHLPECLHSQFFFDQLDQITEFNRTVISQVEDLIGGSQIDGSRSSCDDIVDIGKVATHLSLIEDLD